MIPLILACSNAVGPGEPGQYARDDTAPVDTADTAPEPVGRIVINEVLADNEDGIINELGEAEDWLELHNAGDATLDMVGWTLSDGSTEPWVIEPPQALAPGGFLIIWCDEEKAPDLFQLHAPFKLSAKGENIVLSNETGGVIDAVIFPQLETDQSWARLPDGGEDWDYASEPTPGANNR